MMQQQQQQGQQWNQQPAPSQGPQPYGGGSQNPGSDNEIRSLWIGALQPWMDEDYTMTIFAQTGEVQSAKVIRNKLTGMCEGYGFIEFANHAAAERVLQMYNGTQVPNSHVPPSSSPSTCSPVTSMYLMYLPALPSNITTPPVNNPAPPCGNRDGSNIAAA